MFSGALTLYLFIYNFGNKDAPQVHLSALIFYFFYAK